jgi:putative transposase
MVVFSYEAVREWEAKLTPILSDELRQWRGRRRLAPSWYVDETYIRVRGRWCYLYRAIDRDGALVEVMLSERRDLAAAKRFFRSARAVTGAVPNRVTSDGHDAYPRAIRTELGKTVTHRTNTYLNNRLEQDHRGIKGRIRCMHGFGSVASASRFCRGHDELRNFLRVRSCPNCGSGVINGGDSDPDRVVGLVGTLDDPTPFVPNVEIFCDTAWPWAHDVSERKRFRGMPV